METLWAWKFTYIYILVKNLLLKFQSLLKEFFTNIGIFLMWGDYVERHNQAKFEYYQKKKLFKNPKDKIIM